MEEARLAEPSRTETAGLSAARISTLDFHLNFAARFRLTFEQLPCWLRLFAPLAGLHTSSEALGE